MAQQKAKSKSEVTHCFLPDFQRRKWKYFGHIKLFQGKIEQILGWALSRKLNLI